MLMQFLASNLRTQQKVYVILVQSWKNDPIVDIAKILYLLRKFPNQGEWCIKYLNNVNSIMLSKCPSGSKMQEIFVSNIQIQSR